MFSRTPLFKIATFSTFLAGRGVFLGCKFQTEKNIDRGLIRMVMITLDSFAWHGNRECEERSGLT